MCPSNNTLARQKIAGLGRQSGSMLVMGIFVMLVLSLLIVTLMRVLSASSDALIHEVYGLRAMNAANAGLEAQLSSAFAFTDLDGGAATPTCADMINVNFGDTTGLQGCSYTSSCEQRRFEDEGITYYRFVSTGTCEVGNMVTSRTLAIDAQEPIE